MTDPASAARVAELRVLLLRAAVRMQDENPDLTNVEVLTALVEVADQVLADMRGPRVVPAGTVHFADGNTWNGGPRTG